MAHRRREWTEEQAEAEHQRAKLAAAKAEARTKALEARILELEQQRWAAERDLSKARQAGSEARNRMRNARAVCFDCRGFLYGRGGVARQDDGPFCVLDPETALPVDDAYRCANCQTVAKADPARVATALVPEGQR